MNSKVRTAEGYRNSLISIWKSTGIWKLPRRPSPAPWIKKSSNAYKEVEKRFAISQDPEDALFLARYYYEKKRYKKAEEWAFIANELNDESEESWLIYAQAKAARGEHLKAIHILDGYLQKSNSLRARKLLEEYKTKLSKK